MDLSIIIVNWNSKELLLECISSIIATTNGIEYEILVIDSASFDGAGESLRSAFPQVRFLQSFHNDGFAKANNKAALISSGEALLLLNPDTLLLGPAIEILYKNLTKLPLVGLVGGKLLNSDGTVQTSCVRAFPTVVNQLFDSDVLRQLFPRSYLWGMRVLFDERNSPTAVEAISGACMMLKRAVFFNADMFSSEYFMYSEDIDLCYKVKQLGLEVCYVPDAVVMHYGGQSSAKASVNSFPIVMMLESRWKFLRKIRPVWYAYLFRLAILVGSVARICVLVVILPAAALLRREPLVFNRITKWIKKIRWTLGWEGWAAGFPGSSNR